MLELTRARADGRATLVSEAPSAPMTEVRWLRLLGALVVGLATMVVVGWIGHLTILVTLLPDGSPTVMNTALCLLLCGCALLALGEGFGRLAGW